MTAPSVTRGEDAARTRSAWFDTQRGSGITVLLGVCLVLAAATSGIQGMGYTSTVLSGICLLVAPGYLLTTATPAERLFIWLAAIGAAGFVISFALNGLGFVDQRIMQWPSFALYFIGFTVLAGRQLAGIFAIAAGVALGSCFYFLTSGLPELSEPSVEAFWKYAFAPAVTVLVLYTLSLLRVPTGWQAATLLVLAVVSLGLNYRSHALTCIAAATAVIAATAGRRLRRSSRLAVTGLVVVALGYTIPIIARSGLAGESIRQKTEQQDMTGAPALLAGRTEPPLSFTAIMDRPLFGWGTANNITADVVARAQSLAVQLGFDPSVDLRVLWHLPDGSMSLHSTLLNAWAEGGVFAALLPMMLLIAAVSIVWNCDRFGRWTALATAIGVQAIWDLCFSPTSYNSIPMFAVLAAAFAATHLPGRAGSVESISP